jgi:hypothetical protein
MIYTCANASIGKIRGKHDLAGSMLAGGLAGALFRSAGKQHTDTNNDYY